MTTRNQLAQINLDLPRFFQHQIPGILVIQDESPANPDYNSGREK